MNRLSGASTILAILAMGLVPAEAGAGDQEAVPDVAWREIVPYLRANFTVALSGDQVRVGASSWSREAEIAGAYDPVLDEPANVLLVEALQEKQVGRAISEVKAGLGSTDRETALRDPEAFRSISWDRLVEGGLFLHEIRDLFERARDRGRLACYICEQGFTPQHLARR